MWRTNRRIEIDSVEQKLRRALGIKYDPASTEVDDAILAVRERAEISSHCFAHLASKISVRSKEEANLLTMSWQVQMDSLNRIYKLMKHLDKRVKGVDNRVASIQRSFNATIKNLTDRATEREEKCFHHIKKLELAMWCCRCFVAWLLGSEWRACESDAFVSDSNDAMDAMALFRAIKKT